MERRSRLVFEIKSRLDCDWKSFESESLNLFPYSLEAKITEWISGIETTKVRFQDFDFEPYFGIEHRNEIIAEKLDNRYQELQEVNFLKI